MAITNDDYDDDLFSRSFTLFPHLPCHSRESGNPEFAFAGRSLSDKFKSLNSKSLKNWISVRRFWNLDLL